MRTVILLDFLVKIEGFWVEKGEKLPDLDKEEELPGTEGKKHNEEEKKCEEGCEHHH